MYAYAPAERCDILAERHWRRGSRSQTGLAISVAVGPNVGVCVAVGLDRERPAFAWLLASAKVPRQTTTGKYTVVPAVWASAPATLTANTATIPDGGNQKYDTSSQATSHAPA